MDLSIKLDGGRFNFRTAVILLDNERVLLHKNEYDEHWALPGGRVALFEETEATAVREMKEELDVDVEVERLLWFTENFFDFEGEAFHEIAAYYKVNLLSDLYKGNNIFHGKEGDRILLYQWFPIEQLRQVELYPYFLREGLKEIPTHTQFISIKD
ncbi:NUDIX hydrolase [Ornithinibacillus halophilus]|uniref:ADP-ribose pyrophosphatase YjhB, NUDIX family n=1 Tax=Ornithinibacillus halophilus TaxID=930117 RepID=A0A1M5MCA5_9BACI|nr:NUDIX hydrolase [Ornithinibacillus halophilus]SHG74896.1 ADP-ribose pyrophosphatase YjhB, NUDIX family [Ornithinibacillus halophilus]